MATPFTGFIHYFSLLKKNILGRKWNICFEFPNGEREGTTDTGEEAEKFFFFLFLNVPPSWMDMGQKEMIKNCLVRWILSSISEHPDKI